MFRSLTCLTVALAIHGCQATPIAPEIAPDVSQREGDAQDLPSVAVLRAHLADVRDAYVALDQADYRYGVFALLSGLGPEDGTQPLLDLVEACLAEGAEGGLDGIEAVLLYAVDGVYARGSEAEIAQVEAQLAAHEAGFVVPDPNSALLVPVGRLHTAVFLDVRADAVRTLVDRVLSDGRMPSDGFDGLLGLESLLDELCALEARGEQDRGVEVTPFQQGLDEQRQAGCGEAGKPGGPGNGGAAGGLGNLAEGACFDGAVDFGKTDPTAQQFADLVACAESLSGQESPHGPGNVALGASGLLGPIGTGAELIWEWFLYKQDEIEAVHEANDAYAAAVEAFSWAVQEAIAAQDALADAQDAVGDAEAALDQAVAGGDEQEIADAEASLQEAQEVRDQAQADFNSKLDCAEGKGRAAEEAAREVERATKDADGVTSPDDPFRSTDECEAAFNNVFEGTQWDQDREEALAEANPATGVNPWVANWDSESDFGIDALGMAPCGMDPATVNPGSMTCDALVLCGPEEPHCSCSNATQPGAAAAQLAGAADLMCSMVIQCIDGAEMGASGCGCAGEEAPVDLEGVGPDVTGPPTRFLQATFASRDVVEGMELSTTERAVVGALRDDVGVDEVMSEEFGQP